MDEFVSDWVFEKKKDLYKLFIDHYFVFPKPGQFPRPDPCLSCPTLDILKDVLLRGMIQRTSKLIEPIIEQIKMDQKYHELIDLNKFQNEMDGGMSDGFEHLKETLEKSIDYTRKLFDDSCKTTDSKY